MAMKVTKDGKELKDAKVLFDQAGNPEFVLHGGLKHFARFFKFEEEKVVKKTKDSPKTSKKTK